MQRKREREREREREKGGGADREKEKEREREVIKQCKCYERQSTTENMSWLNSREKRSPPKFVLSLNL